jgi:predicted ATPase/DNA-binding CsgD family transcriptional regulator
VPGMPWVQEGKLTFPTHLARDSVLVGNDAWRQWLCASETTSFRFEGEGTAFTARRELRAGRAYWYAYRRCGQRLEKAYLGRSEEIDLDRLRDAAVRLSVTASSGQRPGRTRAPPSKGIETGYLGRLPAPATRLIGRERDVTAVRERLLADAARLVTLTGPGGTGKTRLAIEVATQLAEAFPDGVVFVDLAPLSHPDHVVPAIARALGLRDLGERPVREGVYEWLGPRHGLLLLDNFEHLLPAAADLADLLANCLQVSALVTSREALHLRWERVVLVPPLDLPTGLGEALVQNIAASPAVMLFVERARDRNPAFQLTTENASAVADICARLDGLPLAIELAAARARLLTPYELAQRLNRRLPLLDEGPRDAPGRQRTLRNAIGWSHDLLSMEEHVLFRRLAVFVGGFTVAAAEVVASRTGHLDAAPPGERPLRDLPVLDLLQSLMDKSLLKRETDAAETRFRLLETVREYGLERLEASREVDVLRARHAAYCLALVRQINADPNEVTRSDRIEREHDNVRAALRWALERGDLVVGLRLAASLRRFWWRRGYLTEGRRWLAELLARTDHDPTVSDAPEWATALGAAGYLAWAQADYSAALASHRAALERWVQLQQPRGIAAAQGFLATTLCWQGDLRAARPLLEQALAGWRALGNAVGAGNALFQLGLVALFEQRYAEADDLLRQALGLHEAERSVNDAAYDLTMIGYVAVQRSHLGEARRRLVAARELVSQLDDHWGVLFLLESAAALAAAEGDPQRALRLMGVSSALRDRTGAHLPPAFRDCFAPWLRAARRSLPEVEAEAAMSGGRSLAPGQAISAEQLQALLTDDSAPRAAGGRALSLLTRREHEIAACVARGWTNDQIAASLVVSRRTVESHVSHILSKLDFATRAQLAVWATQNGVVGARPPN